MLSSAEDSFAPNSKIQVNGWVISRPAYPTNVAPFNNGVWFTLSPTAMDGSHSRRAGRAAHDISIPPGGPLKDPRPRRCLSAKVRSNECSDPK